MRNWPNSVEKPFGDGSRTDAAHKGAEISLASCSLVNFGSNDCLCLSADPYLALTKGHDEAMIQRLLAALAACPDASAKRE